MTTSADLAAAAARFQRELLAAEQGDAKAIMSAYGQSARRMRDALKRAREAIHEGPGAGVSPSAWVREDARIRSLIAVAESEMNKFAGYAADAIERRQAALVAEAQAHQAELLDLQANLGSLSEDQLDRLASLQRTQGNLQANLAGFERAGRPSIVPVLKTIPVEAVTQLVGSLGDGTALQVWAEQFGAVQGQRIGEALIEGLTRGEGAERVAARLTHLLDGNAAQALTVARTETLRAYRGATTLWTEQNTKLVEGYQWYARLDRRTCPSCWAMHGTYHRPGTVMGSHPNCRCIPIAVLRPWSDIIGSAGEGLPEPPRLPSGADVFAKQSADFQRSVLGPRRYDAYKAGKADLPDFVRKRTDPGWGVSRTTNTATAAVKRKNART